MRLTLDTYWPLLLPLIIVPFLWWVQHKTMTDLSPRHLKLSGLIRSAMVVLLAFAIMQPILYRSGDWISAIYLLDVSQSVSPAAIQSGMQWIQETNQIGNPDHARFIPFGANSFQLENADQLKSVNVSTKPIEGSIDQSATHIEDALDHALRSFAPHHLKRLVLITDGNENSGKIMDLAPRLKQEGVHVYTLPESPRASRDAWVETIMAPPQISAEETFPMEIHVYSQTEADADVEVKVGDKSLGLRKLHLAKGINRVAFESQIKDDRGPVTLEAEVRAAGDTFGENNTFRKSIVVQGKPRVLYVESRAESAKYLKDALQLEGFDVDVKAPSAIPEEVGTLDGYDTVVLSDVARASLNDKQMQAIATYVRDLGGGFILAGGENNFGEGGYSKTLIEEVLPVTFEVKKEKPQKVAMIIVLDKSGSMGGQKMQLAKEATKAPLSLLRDEDSFGVVAFDYNFYWPANLQSVKNREAILVAIGKILAGGETNAFPALGEAFLQLSPVEADVKHVILLSDGRSLADDFKGLVTKMADSEITVSTVAVGEGADRELLADIAKWGKGRAYFLEDPNKVPQIFIEETKLTTGETLHEDPFIPIVKKKVQAFKGIDLAGAPQLLGYVTTKAKETAEILLETTTTEPDKNDPILARWQYGLGQTIAFTSDVKDRWAVNWLTWRGYPKFWSQLVRETMRRQDTNDFNLNVERVENDAKITIEATEKDGRFRNKLQTQIKVILPDQTTADVDVRQTGPGFYEAKFPLTQKGPYLFRAVDEQAGGPSRVLAYSYPEEYHFYPANTELLRSISTETGGKFQPQPEEVFAPNGETTALPTPLWPFLAGLAVLLYVGDVLLRRIRIFE